MTVSADTSDPLFSTTSAVSLTLRTAFAWVVVISAAASDSALARPSIVVTTAPRFAAAAVRLPLLVVRVVPVMLTVASAVELAPRPPEFELALATAPSALVDCAVSVPPALTTASAPMVTCEL